MHEAKERRGALQKLLERKEPLGNRGDVPATVVDVQNSRAQGIAARYRNRGV